MSSIRYFSAILTSLLCTTSALAGEGFYVGAGIGYGTTAFNFESNIIEPNTINPATPVADKKLEESGAVGEIHGGYEWIFLTQSMSFSLAAEIFAEFQSRDFDLDTTIDLSGLFPGYNFKAKTENVYGASIKPGVFLSNNFLVYLNIGAVYMQLNEIESSLTGIVLPFPSGTFEDKNEVGLRTGVGLEWLITKQISLDFSWVRDSYNDFDDKRELANDTTSLGTVIEERIEFNKFYNDRFLLAFNYYFSAD